jgi:hypothetical protein
MERRPPLPVEAESGEVKRGAIAVLADLSRGLSGGDILNICLNAIYAGSADLNPERRMVTHGMLEREITNSKKAKAEHTGAKGKNRRRIGFQPI